MTDSTRQRLRDLIALLREYPDGLTTSEIAAHLGVTRQTALKDIDRLSYDGIPIYEDESRYVLDSRYQKQIELSLAQAWFMYLPLRRIVRADLHRSPLVRSLLHRIAALFHEEIADQLIPDSDEMEDTASDHTFGGLVRCWQEQRQAEVQYRRPNADRPTKLVIAPWWFEPAVWSDAFYLIGGLLRGDSYEPITLKLDRIQSVQPLTTGFQRPPGQQITAYLEKTWGIWVGEGVQVRLRFHNRQFDRLKETRWHPTQKLTVAEDGFILWEAFISEPQEMLPWIRGWGADVEVLEPPNIRQQIAAEAEATARMYGVWDENDASRFF